MLSSTRSSAKAWVMLANLLGVLRPSFTARTLSSHQFLTIVENALHETFGIPDSEENSVKISMEESSSVNVNDGNAFIVSDVEGSSNPEAVTTCSSKRRRHADSTDWTVSKKRKKTADETEHISSRPPKSSDKHPDQVHELFLAISRCLNLICTMSSNTTDVDDGFSAEYMASVLRTDCAQAARLLKCWFIALISLIACESSMSIARLRQADVTFYSLLPALQIWETRLVDTGNDSEIANVSTLLSMSLENV